MFVTGFLLLTCIALTTAYPIEDRTTGIPVQFSKDVSAVFYIEGFKNSMTNYVKSQYQNLTIRETEEVKEVLEEFLTNFAKDLKASVERQFKEERLELNTAKIDDGIPDETFDDISTRVRNEFPDISEETAKEIVYKLRMNLFVTRQKIDQIIRKSQQSQLAYEADVSTRVDIRVNSATTDRHSVYSDIVSTTVKV